MLKAMQTNKFFTMFVLGAITIMISVAFIFWGIGPKDNIAASYVAQIDDQKIALDQYWRAYDSELKRLKDQNKTTEEIEKMNLQDRVLATLVNRAVLLTAASRNGIFVTDRDVQEAIMNTPYFQRNGVFDPEVYKRGIRLSRLTTQTYEASVKNDLIVRRMSNLIGETAELTADELKILDSMEAGNKDQLRSIFLSSKTNQTIQAYIESMKRTIDIQINRDLIS